MKRGPWLSGIFWVLAGVTAVAPPSWAGHLVLSANDGKYPNIDGVYRVADPAPPDTLTVLDVSGFPPRVLAEIKVKHSVAAPPTSVVLTPDEKLALVSAPNRVDPNDKTKLVLEDVIQVVDLEPPLPKSSPRYRWAATLWGCRSTGRATWRWWPICPTGLSRS